MQVQKIGSNSFEAKQRYLTPEMKKNANYLINKMREETKYSDNGNWFTSSIFKELSNKKGNIRFQDGSIYLGNKFKQKGLSGKALFTIGKTEIVIDNQTGEIIDYYKPFFTTWKGIMNKIEKYLSFFKENFDNSELVNQRTLKISGFTEKGLELFEKLKAGKNG